jgi:hypothetical protein
MLDLFLEEDKVSDGNELPGTMTTGNPDWMAERDKWQKFLYQFNGRYEIDEDYFEMLFQIEEELGIKPDDKEYSKKITDYINTKMEPIKKEEHRYRDMEKYGFPMNEGKLY